jgi:cyanuric acid amidohydrolase
MQPYFVLSTQPGSAKCQDSHIQMRALAGEAAAERAESELRPGYRGLELWAPPEPCKTAPNTTGHSISPMATAARQWRRLAVAAPTGRHCCSSSTAVATTLRRLQPNELRRCIATVATLDTSHPGDMASLESFLESNPSLRPRCVLGKTEGNGCVNDFTRAYASSAVEAALGARGDGASIIMSGGTEGILTPHLLLFADGPADADGGEAAAAPAAAGAGRLSLGVARTRAFAPQEIGRRVQAEATRDAVLAACRDAGLTPAELCFAQIKCPLLTPERVAAVAPTPCATEDCYHSMGLSRGASALGVALATGEVPAGQLDEAMAALCTPTDEYRSAVASASAGIELMHSEVFVLGNSPTSASHLRAAYCEMSDAVDAPSVLRMLEEEGIDTQHGQLTSSARGRVQAVLAKADPAPSVRGQRTTMCSDSDINATRHSRAAIGGLLGGIFGTGRLYVSGGAEHQGPAGGGPVCVIYEVEA